MSLATLQAEVLAIPTSDVFVPLLADYMPDGSPVRYKGAWGGRGSGKTEFYAGLMVEESVRFRGFRSVCAREIQKSLDQSVKATLVAMMDRHDVRSYFNIQYNKIITPGDGVILFEGMQDHTSDSVKGLAKFNRCWMEEAHVFSKRSLELLTPTFFRVPNSQIWASWNPETPPSKNPATGGLQGDPVDIMLRYQAPPDAVVVEANFEDNPWFPEGLAKEEEAARRHMSAEDYAHIWRGKYLVRSEKRVFKNWKQAEFDTPARGCIFRFGADFGFSVDPSVLVRCFLGRPIFDAQGNIASVTPDENARDLFIDYEAYRVGCDIDHLPALFAGDDPRWSNPYTTPGIPGALQWSIIADSARPETISYMQRHGFPKMIAAKKGAGSVNEGVEFLKAFNIWIHPRCRHTVDEFTLYSFKIDPRTGNVLPVLEDKKNHVIDACRYAVEDMRRAKGFFG